MQSSVQLPGRAEPVFLGFRGEGGGEEEGGRVALYCKADLQSCSHRRAPVSAEASRDPLRARVGKGEAFYRK